jgi:voltage-gated sodium channel
MPPAPDAMPARSRRRRQRAVAAAEAPPGDRPPAPDALARPSRGRMESLAARITTHRAFTAVVVIVIVANAGLLAVETDAAIAAAHAGTLAAAHAAVLGVFALELALRLVALGRRWPTFFASGWNLFDTAVVLLSLVPAVGATATVARVARLLRVARLISISPKLRLLVTTMVRSVPSLGHVGLLLALIMFVYAVVGVHAFGAIDPAHWGTLPRAALTLFQILTLDGWVELQRATEAAGTWTWVFYASYVLLAVFVIVNLFVAVVLTNLDDARRELAALDDDGRRGCASSRRGHARTAWRARQGGLV